jgi:hypothetical protein
MIKCDCCGRKIVFVLEPDQKADLWLDPSFYNLDYLPNEEHPASIDWRDYLLGEKLTNRLCRICIDTRDHGVQEQPQRQRPARPVFAAAGSRMDFFTPQQNEKRVSFQEQELAVSESIKNFPFHLFSPGDFRKTSKVA